MLSLLVTSYILNGNTQLMDVGKQLLFLLAFSFWNIYLFFTTKVTIVLYVHAYVSKTKCLFFHHCNVPWPSTIIPLLPFLALPLNLRVFIESSNGCCHWISFIFGSASLHATSIAFSLLSLNKCSEVELDSKVKVGSTFPCTGGSPTNLKSK